VGYEQPLDFTIVRDEIKLRSVPYAFVLPDGSGYLRISDFTETTETELHENLERLEEEGVQRLILDLRDNPGGLLDQAVSVSNTFLRKGSKIVSTRGRTHGSDQDFLASRKATYGDLPLVVLVNRGSASASEIVAGAIQDHDRGLIVGETTFGKGLVQSIYRISGGNGLALTTAKYFTPSGRSIQRDYSGSIDDYYYTARRGEDTPGTQGELRHTDAGREVYGGGGISPDIQVTYPRLPKSILSLSSYNVFFNYSALYASKNGRTQNLDGAGVVPEEIRTARSEDVRLIDEKFEVDDAVLKHFFDFLEKEEVPFEKEALIEHRDRLALLIRAEIFSSLWGAEARQHVLLEKDPQVRAGLEALPDAVDLLKDPRAYVSRIAARDKGTP
jgi:carboxyl-terminal processing protease